MGISIEVRSTILGVTAVVFVAVRGDVVAVVEFLEPFVSDPI